MVLDFGMLNTFGTDVGLRERGGIKWLHGSSFLPENESDNILRTEDGMVVSAGVVNFYIQIDLPQGATITSIQTYSATAADTWKLLRFEPVGGSAQIETGTAAAEKPMSVLIDNDAFSYFLHTGDTADGILGVKIKYVFK